MNANVERSKSHLRDGQVYAGLWNILDVPPNRREEQWEVDLAWIKEQVDGDRSLMTSRAIAFEDLLCHSIRFFRSNNWAERLNKTYGALQHETVSSLVENVSSTCFSSLLSSLYCLSVFNFWFFSILVWKFHDLHQEARPVEFSPASTSSQKWSEAENIYSLPLQIKMLSSDFCWRTIRGFLILELPFAQGKYLKCTHNKLK